MIRTLFRLTASLFSILNLSSRPLYGALKAVKSAAHLGAVRRRREMARARPTTAWSGLVAPDKGYAPLEMAGLVGIDDVVVACNAVFQAYQARQAEDGDKAKPFFENILEYDDLALYPALLDFATSAPIVDAAVGYLGQVPILRGIGVYVSPVNTSTTRSQMFHVDGDDFRQLKCFINVVEVDLDNGPFTLVSSRKSAQIRKRVKHGWRDRRLTDEEVLDGLADDEVVALTGGPGSGALVDTSACLHYGSRARISDRVVFMFQYTTYPSASFDILEDDMAGRALHRFDLAYAAADATKQLLLFAG